VVSDLSGFAVQNAAARVCHRCQLTGHDARAMSSAASPGTVPASFALSVIGGCHEVSMFTATSLVADARTSSSRYGEEPRYARMLERAGPDIIGQTGLPFRKLRRPYRCVRWTRRSWQRFLPPPITADRLLTT
jgi:hypothetical protein